MRVWSGEPTGVPRAGARERGDDHNRRGAGSKRCLTIEQTAERAQRTATPPRWWHAWSQENGELAYSCAAAVVAFVRLVGLPARRCCFIEVSVSCYTGQDDPLRGTGRTARGASWETRASVPSQGRPMVVVMDLTGDMALTIRGSRRRACRRRCDLTLALIGNLAAGVPAARALQDRSWYYPPHPLSFWPFASLRARSF